jgi:hypothetical protein
MATGGIEVLNIDTFARALRLRMPWVEWKVEEKIGWARGPWRRYVVRGGGWGTPTFFCHIGLKYTIVVPSNPPIVAQSVILTHFIAPIQFTQATPLFGKPWHPGRHELLLCCHLHHHH